MMMKKFVCLSCDSEWYSASNIESPCENCGGKLVEADSNPDINDADREKSSQHLH